MAQQMYVAAEEVAEGDFIPGLDNAFVTWIEEDADIRDRYNVGLAHDKITVTYIDADDNEGYLLLTKGTRIEVLRN